MGLGGGGGGGVSWGYTAVLHGCTGPFALSCFVFAMENTSFFNPFALRMTKTPWSFDHSECIKVISIFILFFFFFLIPLEWTLSNGCLSI